MAANGVQSPAAVPPTGVYVPVPTFFKPATPSTIQPELDIETQVAHSVYLARSGIRGLVLLGSTGEAIHLSAAERTALISGVRRGLDAAGFAGYPLMAGVLVNSVDEAVQWARAAHGAGAQWALVLVPGYFGAQASQPGIAAWFRAVADAAPLPLLLYHYPGVTNGVRVETATYEALAAHPNIVGAKMSHGDVAAHIQVACNPRIDHARFRLFSGFGQQLAPIVMMGAAGVIDGLAAFYPKAVVRLMQLAEKRPITEEELREVRRLQFASSHAAEVIGKWGILGIREGIYRELGMGNLEGGRLPLRGKLPSGEWETLKTFYEPIRKIEKAL